MEFLLAVCWRFTGDVMGDGRNIKIVEAYKVGCLYVLNIHNLGAVPVKDTLPYTIFGSINNLGTRTMFKGR
jgi:hypothetical protein